jgi:four helix bundle protein
LDGDANRRSANADGGHKSKNHGLGTPVCRQAGEKLDVYRLAIGYVAWVFEHSEKLNGVHRHARDQWLRASQSIPLNIAEGNGKTAEADRRRYFEIARGSALECAAIQDVLVVAKALEESKSRERKTELDRMAAMLSRLGKRGYSVQEESAGYGVDPDFDSDFDSDEMKSQPDAALNADKPRE